MSFIIKNLKSNTIDSREYLKISSFNPRGLRKLIKMTPDNCYILGVGYIYGDYQICISGHPKRGENLLQGLIREMREELYIKPNNIDGHIFSCDNNFFFKFNINDTVISLIHEDNKEKDTNNRVIVCIYGTELEIIKYMINLGDYNINSDGINSIWACSKEKILKIMS